MAPSCGDERFVSGEPGKRFQRLQSEGSDLRRWGFLQAPGEDIEATAGGHPGSGCYWVSIGTPDGGEILISGQGRHEAEVYYPLTEHAGWLVCRYDESGLESTILHDSHDPDLAADTAAAVKTVRASLATG